MVIRLSNGMIVLVDSDDFRWLDQYKWYALRGQKTYYAKRWSHRENGKQIHVQMHRQILGLKPGDGKEVDHINGCGWDNRRDNLRIVSRRQNLVNSGSRINSSSKYVGVGWHRTTNKWRSYITNPKSHKYEHLGLFRIEKEAACARDQKAFVYYGENAKLNFKKEEIL